jgi:hypothetical protein
VKIFIWKGTHKYFWRLFLLTIPLCLPVFIADSQIKRCKGVITNKECDDGETLFPELPPKTIDPKLKEDRSKLEMVRQFKALVSRSRSRYGVDLSSDVTETFCRQVTLSQCRELIVKKEVELNALTEKARIAKVKIEHSEKKQRVKKDEDKQRKSSVTVIQNRIIERSYDTLEPFPPPTVSAPQISIQGGVVIRKQGVDRGK